jgi:hypothetical protein
VIDNNLQRFADRAREARTAPSKARPIFSESRSSQEFRFTRRTGVRMRLKPVPNYAVRLGDQKLIRTLEQETTGKGTAAATATPVYRYYDLASDSGERRALPGTGRAALPLRVLLDRYISSGEAAAPDRDAIPAEARVLDADRHEKLKALGYLD